MGKERQADEGNLYGRVLQRLTLALEEAERRTGDDTGAAAELEVGGLTPAEFDLIRAYLQQDSQWLSGWHAAAEEQAQVARSVDENLVAIGDLSHQSAASSEQTSAASDALAQLAVQLNDRVGQFRL